MVYYSYTNNCREIVAMPWSDCECMTVSDIVAGEEHAVQLKKVTDEEFTSPIKHETMIVRLAEIEVYPEHLTEYLKFANEVDRQSVEREPDVVCLFPMQRLRIPRRFASSKSMPPRKPIRATSRPSISRSTSRAPCTW